MNGAEGSELVVLTRAPVAGRVMRRLWPALGAAGAARLQAALLQRLASVTASAGYDRVTCRADDPEHPLLRRLARQSGWCLVAQGTGDLGQRMAHAFADAWQRAVRVVLIGSDCPVLEADHLRRARTALAHADAVLGPAEDGGYLLLGLRASQPVPFKGVAWGTDRVLAQTRAQLAAAGQRWIELPRLWDLDRPADLDRLWHLDPPWARDLARTFAASSRRLG